MTGRAASCHCGRLVLRCEGEPRKVSLCHCLDCQRRTGSVFSIAVFYQRERTIVEQGATRAFARPSASGFPVTFHFCEACGSNLYWEPARMPDLVGVAAGAFADPNFPAPHQAVWTRDQQAWLTLPPDMPAYPRNP